MPEHVVACLADASHGPFMVGCKATYEKYTNGQRGPLECRGMFDADQMPNGTTRFGVEGAGYQAMATYGASFFALNYILYF